MNEPLDELFAIHAGQEELKAGLGREAIERQYTEAFAANRGPKMKAALSGGLLSQKCATATEWWRWGELNPRPPLWSYAFYGCIQWCRSTRLRNLPLAAKPTSPVRVSVPLRPQT